MNPAHYGSHPWIIVIDVFEGLEFLTGANPREFGPIEKVDGWATQQFAERYLKDNVRHKYPTARVINILTIVEHDKTVIQRTMPDGSLWFMKEVSGNLTRVTWTQDANQAEDWSVCTARIPEWLNERYGDEAKFEEIKC